MLNETINDIEFVFDMFPQDPGIRKASVDLVATILDTAERVIGFYDKGLPRKMLAAYLKGDGYENNILHGLSDVKERSEHLARQKANADITLSRQEARFRTKIGGETLENSRMMGPQTSDIKDMLVEVRDSNVDLHDMVLRLLDEAEKNKQRNAMLEQTLRARTPTVSIDGCTMQTTYPTTNWTITPGARWSLLQIPEETE